jgi:hypothetical protein
MNRTLTISPTIGTSPRPNARAMLKYICISAESGSRFLTRRQVFRTATAIIASAMSPTLFMFRALSERGKTRTYRGINPTTELQPNLIPQQENRPESRKCTLSLTLISISVSCMRSRYTTRPSAWTLVSTSIGFARERRQTLLCRACAVGNLLVRFAIVGIVKL